MFRSVFFILMSEPKGGSTEPPKAPLDPPQVYEEEIGHQKKYDILCPRPIVAANRKHAFHFHAVFKTWPIFQERFVQEATLESTEFQGKLKQCNQGRDSLRRIRTKPRYSPGFSSDAAQAR